MISISIYYAWARLFPLAFFHDSFRHARTQCQNNSLKFWAEGGGGGERYSILRLTSHSRWISLTPICFVTHFPAIFRQCGPLASCD